MSTDVVGVTMALCVLCPVANKVAFFCDPRCVVMERQMNERGRLPQEGRQPVRDDKGNCIVLTPYRNLFCLFRERMPIEGEEISSQVTAFHTPLRTRWIRPCIVIIFLLVYTSST